MTMGATLAFGKRVDHRFLWLGSQIGILVPGLDSIPVPLVTGLNLSPIPKIPSTALYMPNPLYPSVPS